MKPTSAVKIFAFLLLGIFFGGSLIVYSNSRGYVKSDRELPIATDVNGTDDDHNRHYERQFTVNEGGEVLVNADAGTVMIESWDKKELKVTVDIEGSDSRVNKYNVEFKQDGDKVTIIGKVRDRSFFKWNVGNLDARYTIYTPKKFSVDVKTSGGDIGTKNISGKVQLNTSGGNVRVANIEGETFLSTSGGDVEANDITGDIEAETSGGNVRGERVKGSFKGHTSGGDVVIGQIDGRVDASTSGGNIKVKVNGDNKGIVVETSGGNIDIYVKKDIGADIDARTTGGSVDCDLPVTVKGKVKESELHGKINGGGNLIKAETSGGSIRIAAL